MTTSVPERKRSIFQLTKILAKPILYPFFQLKTNGVDHLPKNSAFILLPKHQRWEDIPLLVLATPRPLYYMAKYELFLNPFTRWYLASLGGIPLNRKRPLESRRSLRRMIEFLKKGEGIVIFPEGTYYRDRMGPGRVGLIRMVHSRLSIPFIPVGIRYSKKRSRTSVRINFGNPLYEDLSKDMDQFFNNIMKEIARLSGF